MAEYRKLQKKEINRSLFRYFIRHQVVTKCWRRGEGKWCIKDDAFDDDWTEQDYGELRCCLQKTVRSGGLVYAAFCNDALKGFVSVESELFGASKQYLDLSNIHVLGDMRNRGIGGTLFRKAKQWAKEHGAEKTLHFAHSAIESRMFYQKRGCVEAKQHHQEHIEKEPCDCQLECAL